MADIYVDRADDGKITVKVCRGMSEPKTKIFADRAEAERFATASMGKRSGMILSTLDMTSDQLARHKAKTERMKAWAAECGALLAANLTA